MLCCSLVHSYIGPCGSAHAQLTNRNGVSLAGRWWFETERWLGSFVIFQGVHTSDAKETYSFVIFPGGVQTHHSGPAHGSLSRVRKGFEIFETDVYSTWLETLTCTDHWKICLCILVYRMCRPRFICYPSDLPNAWSTCRTLTDICFSKLTVCRVRILIRQEAPISHYLY